MFTYTADFIPRKVVVFGCGGTGSRVVPLVAQFLKTCPWVDHPTMYLVDGDKVEEKNLSRQNFISSDVGEYKAQVLAERYGPAFGIDILHFNSFIPNLTTFESSASTFKGEAEGLHLALFSEHPSSSVVYIICVDSVEARLSILGYLLYVNSLFGNRNSLIVDAGNGTDFGQVKIMNMAVPYYASCSSTNEEIEACEKIPLAYKVPALPFDIEYFLSMEDLPGGSCAELDQTMAINVLMATTIFGILQNFYFCKPITFSRIDLTLHSGSRTVPISAKLINMAKSVSDSTYGTIEAVDIPRDLKDKDTKRLLRHLAKYMVQPAFNVSNVMSEWKKLCQETEPKVENSAPTAKRVRRRNTPAEPTEVAE